MTEGSNNIVGEESKKEYTKWDIVRKVGGLVLIVACSIFSI